MEVSIPAELVFAIAVFLFAYSLFLYGGILKRLLQLIRHPAGIWIFPIVGAIILLLAALFHFLPLTIYPRLDPSRTDQLMKICQDRSVEAVGIFLAGLVSLFAAWIYTRWTSR
ncbi:MAG: hypothetical protein AB1393_13975 [Candidatus Edwardsbacteria bacterium]